MRRRRQRRTNKNDERRYELGWVGLVLAFVVFLVIGSLLGDARGMAYEMLGGTVWTVFLGITFLLVLLYFAQFVLPQGEESGWSEGIDMVRRHYILRGNRFLKNMTSSPQAEKPPESSLPVSFKKLQAGFVPSHQVLAIGRGSGFSRAAGPGFVVLYKGEQVKEAIDLRPQVRGQSIRAITRDGIPVETMVGVTFTVRRQSEDQPQNGRPYSYDRAAIFEVAYFHSMSAQEGQQMWTEQVAPRAVALVTDRLARHSLDDLYNSEQNGRLLLNEISEDVRNTLSEALRGNGIELMEIGIGHLRPPVQVQEQRVRSWQSGWERRIKVREGVGQAEALRLIKRRRARAQIEIINNILESIDAMRYVEDATLSEIIMLRMIQVLEETAEDESIRKLLPEQVISKLVLDASSEMRQLLEGPKSDGKKNGKENGKDKEADK